MAKKQHLNMLRLGSRVWNKWRPRYSTDLRRADPDLSGVDLTNIKVPAYNFDGCNLSGSTLSGVWEASHWSKVIRFTDVNFRGADLSGVIFTNCHFHGCNFTSANLDGVIPQVGTAFKGCQMDQATFRSAQLGRCSFEGSSMRNADFTKAVFFSVAFTAVVLEGANFEQAYVSGPLEIDVSTFYKSRGAFPRQFLRDAGIPEDFIRFMSQSQSQSFYSCFISYSHRDEQFVKCLHSRMQREGLRVWYAREDMRSGKKLIEQISEAIRIHDKLLIVLSAESLKSEWVMTEIRQARRTEVETKVRKLFPVRLVDMETLKQWQCFDADTGKDLAVEVREYFIPDFSEWQDSSKFDAGFRGLLESLKPQEAIPTWGPKDTPVWRP